MKTKAEIMKMYFNEMKQSVRWENSEVVGERRSCFIVTSTHFRASGMASVLERDFFRDLNRIRKVMEGA